MSFATCIVVFCVLFAFSFHYASKVWLFSRVGSVGMSVRSLGVIAKTSASCLCHGSRPFCLGRECLCLVRVMLLVPSVLGKLLRHV